MLAPHRIKAEEHGKFRHGLICARFVGLAHHKNIGDFQDARLDCLHLVTHTRRAHYEHSLSSAHDFDFCLPGAYCFNDDGIVARSIHSAHNVAG